MDESGRCVTLDYGKRGKVYLYTRWEGAELPKIVIAALLRWRGKWGDPYHLARVIFCEMIEGSPYNDPLVGILPDNAIETDYPDVVVDLIDNTVDGIAFEQLCDGLEYDQGSILVKEGKKPNEMLN